MTTSTKSPATLLLFAPAQNPLPVRYPHPHKPRLNLPALVHRSIHNALDVEIPSVYVRSSSSASASTTVLIPHPDSIVKQDEPRIVSSSGQNGNIVSNGSAVSSDGPLSDGPDNGPINGAVDTANATIDLGSTRTDAGASIESEITFKLHLVGSSSTAHRVEWVEEALSVAKEFKGLERIDNLLIGFKGVDYKGKKTAVSEFFGCGAEGLESGSGVDSVGQEVDDAVYETWRAVQSQVGARVGQLGTLYLPLGVLKRLAESKEGPGPGINMLDTPDCHSLPKEYTAYARDKGIALWAGGGGEGADPLPDTELHNVLVEFRSHLTSLLPSCPALDRLQQLIPLREDDLKYETSVAPAVNVKWALGYTVISKSRNVVKDKGYIISATLNG